MRNAHCLLALSTICVFAPQAFLGQSSSITVTSGTVTMTNVEPARINLGELFKIADVVAVVRVVAGDAESYDVAIYKAVVVSSFKGATDGNTIYFGKFIGVRLGWEYVIFLRNAKEPATPKEAKNPAFGTVKYLAVFNEGYSAMESSYSCVFDGKIPSQSCDYGVRVCTDYIVLPKEVRAFPPEENDPPFGCRWVRKSEFTSLLGDLREQPGVIK